MVTLHSKKTYVIHYRNLQQAIKNGLVYRVIQFNQSDWLKKYIELNTEMRKKAKNAFEKDFFKLLNNAVFGKTMESVRKRIQMELVCSEKRLQKLINKCTIKHCTTYEETLNVISLENKIIDFCKPIYIVLQCWKFLRPSCMIITTTLCKPIMEIKLSSCIPIQIHWYTMSRPMIFTKTLRIIPIYLIEWIHQTCHQITLATLLNERRYQTRGLYLRIKYIPWLTDTTPQSKLRGSVTKSLRVQ